MTYFSREKMPLSEGEFFKFRPQNPRKRKKWTKIKESAFP
jgi:hypothetical protein